tara:strand:- start:342 stop:536 length:195 start_codon:yes stop_codon:yes gene_type:complete
VLVSIPITGGLRTSYPLPEFNNSTDFNGPKKIWLSEIGERICTPFINIPMSLIGDSCLELTNKF